MQVLATVQPGAGHLLPVVPLLRALHDAGHRVLLACSPALVPLAGRFGLTAQGVGPMWSWSAPEQLLGRPAAHGAAAEQSMLTDAVDVARFAVLADLRVLLADLRPDLVVHEQYEPSGALAAELTATPCLCVGHGYSPYVTGAASQALRPVPIRAVLGLPARPAADWTYAYADTFPPSLHPFPPEPDLRRWSMRPVPVDVAGPAVPAQGSRPRVLVTLGTASPWRAQVLALVEQAVRQVGGVPLVLGGGSGFDPFTPLLAAADAVVTHGGSGSTVAALAAGLPVLVLPGQLEQRYLGFRVAGAGAGLVLGEDEVDADALREALRRLLADPAYAWNAKRLAAEIAAMPPPGDTARRLDALLSGAARGEQTHATAG